MDCALCAWPWSLRPLLCSRYDDWVVELVYPVVRWPGRQCAPWLAKTRLSSCSYCTSRCLSGVLIAVSCLHCALRETASGLLLHSADHVVALAVCAHNGCVCSCLAGT